MADGRSDHDLPVRIFLRPIGSPLTVGLAGLGIASLLESGLALGWVSSRDAAHIGLALVAVPFVLQLLACVFSYLARDGASGATVGVLSTTWLAIGLLHISTGGTGRDGALGLLELAASATLLASAVTVVRINGIAGAIFVLAAGRFAVDAIYQLGGAAAWQHAAGIVGLVVSASVLYALPAYGLEEQKRETVLPTFRRERGLTSVHGSGADQVAGLADEPGISQTN